MRTFPFFHVFLIVFFCVNQPIIAQKTPLDRLLEKEPFPIQWFDTTALAPDEKLVYFDFGGSKILNPAAVKAMKSQTITDIYYIFTAYTLSEDLQTKLNRRRLTAFDKAAGGILSDPAIHWEIIEQVGPDDAAAASQLFHGFLVRYRPKIDAKFMADEVESLRKSVKCGLVPAEKPPVYVGGKKELMKKMTEIFPFPVSKTDKGRTQSKITFRVAPSGAPFDVRFPRGVDKVHDTLVRKAILSLKNWENGDSSVLFTLIVSYNGNPGGEKTITFNGIRANQIVPCADSGMAQIRDDSSILKTFERHPDWDKMLIVHDLTGSMSPYTKQLLQWHALQANVRHTKKFVFFNDGNLTPDETKEIGNTGGIYEADAQNFEKVKETVFRVMANGFGGDLPENNCEALLYGIQSCPDCKEIVMIADNFAPPRDLILAEKITRPVRVIICGGNGFVNPAYLYLAWKTGGSIHTLQSDIDGLVGLQEGQKITIEQEVYRILNGRFVHLGRI